MNAQETAAAIRPHWDSEPSPLSPTEQHKMRFVMDVCRELGLAPDPINSAQAANLIRKLGLKMHMGDEYPKALNVTDKYGRDVEARYPHGHPKAGLPVVFENAEEEGDYMAAVAPADERGDASVFPVEGEVGK